MKLGLLGRSISCLAEANLVELTSGLQFYDLEALELALSVTDELDLPNGPSFPKLRRRVHIGVPSSGGKKEEQKVLNAESAEEVPKDMQEPHTSPDATSAQDVPSTTMV